jgi:predicted alpha/beta-fold hydrolase
MNNHTYIYNSQVNSTNLVVVNHGVSEDIRSEFIQKISNKAYNAGSSTLLLQMPYMNRKENGSSEGLVEEIASVDTVLSSIDLSQYTTIHFVGKSLGALIFINYIYQNRSKLSQVISVTFLGFLVEFTKLQLDNTLTLNIIQGSNDKYGTKAQLEEIIATYPDININVNYIDNADHSYRNTDKVPVYQDQAIDLIKF